MRVNVSELAGELPCIWEDGERVHEVIAPVLERGEAVVLDFNGVKDVGGAFFAGAIGRLVERDAANRLPELLRYENLSPRDRGVLDAIIAHWTRRREIPGYGRGW